MKQRTHWTISALKDFETCPAKYRWGYLFEASDWLALGYRIVPAKSSPAMERGTEVHQTCEDFLLGKRPDLHPEISPAWAMNVRGLKALGAVPEQQWEFDRDWHPPGEQPLWLRMKIDAHYEFSKGCLAVIDFKTGKPYAANMEQVEVYALGAFAKFDDIDTVIGELWYFDGEEPDEKTFKRSDAPKLARKWEQRASRLLEANGDYPARPNKFCNWCPYNFAKGGPCTAPPRSSR
jgi:hypothetical protein